METERAQPPTSALGASAGPSDGMAAALPLAAAATLALARALPIAFRYRPNDLGIVSIATQQRYPAQQELFWLAFGVGVGSTLAWAFARGLRRARAPLGARVGAEALGVAALLAVLWLPAAPGTALALAAGAGALALARRAPEGTAGPPAATPDAPLAPRLQRALWLGALVLGPPLLASSLGASLWNWSHGVADARLVSDTFRFHAEKGQHLAWANALAHGQLPGRDYFCLYGPLFHLGLLGLWHLGGRSIAGFDLYWALTGAAAWVALLGLGGALLRNRALALLLPFAIPVIRLRVGLPLLGLWLLLAWLRGGRRAWALAAGAAGGAAAVYSQEFAAAYAVAAAVCLALRRDGRAALAFAAGAALTAGPVLGWFAAQGALAPMLRDLVDYPRLVMAGYAKLPFPALAAQLPLSLADFRGEAGLHLRLGYATAALGVAGVLWALPVSDLAPRRPLGSARALAAGLARDPERLALLGVALFGLLSFRSALGRSDLLRVLTALPAPAILFCVACDRTLEAARRPGTSRRLAAWWTAALALFALHAGLFQAGAPWANARTAISNAVTLARHGNHPRGNERINRVTRWIDAHTEPSDPVLFLPNDAAWYYLADRRNPIRFALVSQIATDAQRAEVFDDLLHDAPRYVVWDTRAMNVDGVPESVSLGPAVTTWLHAHYTEVVDLDGVRVLGPRAAPDG